MERREKVVHEDTEPCPYLPGEVARLPLRWQLRPLNAEELDRSLALGERRVGRMLYRPTCPTCRACEPLRVPVREFQPTKSQRRVLRKNEDLRVEIGPATFSEERLHLYNRHKQERGLGRDERLMTRRGYEGWFIQSCTPTVEMRYYAADRLIGLGILDVGAEDASSVYFYFDPDESKRSLGVFSVMAEIHWMRSRGGRYHYLGLYVAACSHLVYKASYYPHERLIGDRWHRVEEAPLGARTPAALPDPVSPD
jgi:arginyl-tRNA--protein-N-Asp/Glu arginylyltransferase